MTVMPQLFVTVDELSLEACWSIVFMHPGGYAVLYRPGIDRDGAEIPDREIAGYGVVHLEAVRIWGGLE